MPNKFISDFEIKGWRKALALGAAGLAGLAPMKGKAREPAPAAPYSQTVGQDPAEAPPLTSDQATTAANFLTDQNPQWKQLNIERIDYDSATDSYTWIGPKTGKPQSWPRARFNREVWVPYQATLAFNALQDRRGTPHLKGSVDYNAKTDTYYWKGPTTGKKMSMKGTDFNDQILAPYLKAQAPETPAPGAPTPAAPTPTPELTPATPTPTPEPTPDPAEIARQAAAEEAAAAERVAEQQAEADPANFFVVQGPTGGVHLHKEADEKSPFPDFVKNGEEVVLLKKEAEWFQVHSSEGTGYIHSELLSSNEAKHLNDQIDASISKWSDETKYAWQDKINSYQKKLDPSGQNLQPLRDYAQWVKTIDTDLESDGILTAKQAKKQHAADQKAKEQGAFASKQAGKEAEAEQQASMAEQQAASQRQQQAQQAQIQQRTASVNKLLKSPEQADKEFYDAGYRHGAQYGHQHFNDLQATDTATVRSQALNYSSQHGDSQLEQDSWAAGYIKGVQDND